MDNRLRPIMVDHETGNVFYMAPDGSPRQLAISMFNILVWIDPDDTWNVAGVREGVRRSIAWLRAHGEGKLADDLEREAQNEEESG